MVGTASITLSVRKTGPSPRPHAASSRRAVVAGVAATGQANARGRRGGRARPAAEVLLVEADGRPRGFALFFTSYSTFLAKPGLYLEDLFVEPDARGRGLGLALMATLAQLCVARGYGRFEWSVLDWNQPALDFYRALGAAPQDEWTVQRLTGPALAALAARAPA